MTAFLRKLDSFVSGMMTDIIAFVLIVALFFIVPLLVGLIFVVEGLGYEKKH